MLCHDSYSRNKAKVMWTYKKNEGRGKDLGEKQTSWKNGEINLLEIRKQRNEKEK